MSTPGFVEPLLRAVLGALLTLTHSVLTAVLGESWWCGHTAGAEVQVSLTSEPFTHGSKDRRWSYFSASHPASGEMLTPQSPRFPSFREASGFPCVVREQRHGVVVQPQLFLSQLWDLCHEGRAENLFLMLLNFCPFCREGVGMQGDKIYLFLN